MLFSSDPENKLDQLIMRVKFFEQVSDNRMKGQNQFILIDPTTRFISLHIFLQIAHSSAVVNQRHFSFHKPPSDDIPGQVR